MESGLFISSLIWNSKLQTIADQIPPVTNVRASEMAVYVPES